MQHIQSSCLATATSAKGLFGHEQGLGLCHGITGNGYALLAAAEGAVDDIGKQQHRAMHFALFAADHWQELYHVPDAPGIPLRGRPTSVCMATASIGCSLKSSSCFLTSTAQSILDRLLWVHDYASFSDQAGALSGQQAGPDTPSVWKGEKINRPHSNNPQSWLYSGAGPGGCSVLLAGCPGPTPSGVGVSRL